MSDNQSFRIVIAYDSFAAAIRAKDLAERVAAQMESEWDPWPFDLLTEPRLRERAVSAASRADMIIIASRGREELPRSVKDWIESWWPPLRANSSALVALLDQELITLGRASRFCAYLQEVAERRNMDFFCNLDLWWQEDRVRTPYGIQARVAAEVFPDYLVADREPVECQAWE